MAPRADDEICVSSSDTMTQGQGDLASPCSVMSSPDLPLGHLLPVRYRSGLWETSVENMGASRLCPANHHVARKCCWFLTSGDSHSVDANTKPVWAYENAAHL